MVSSPVLLMVLMLLHLHLPTIITSSTSSANHGYTIPPHPDFQHFNVKEIIAETKTPPTQFISQHEDLWETHDESSHDQGKWELKLLHRDRIAGATASSLHHNYHDRFLELMKRDARRVTGLNRRLTANTSTGTGPSHHEVDEDFGSEVVSGMDQGSGEYFVRIGVGSPPTSQYMVIDSGSDIVWVQCQPCNQCYRQADPVFDPADSASFAGVSCSSVVCDRLQNANCHAGGCRYELSYNDGSYTKGTLALETISLGSTKIQNVAIGCGHTNRGMFIGAAGLLGLGGGSMSFVGQLGGQAGGAFSYCLVSRGTGSLEFGRGAMPMGAAWVPLIRNPRAPSFYYVGLSGLGVGGVRVPIPEDVFGLTEAGNGGVVMDTGTAVTRLPELGYQMFRDAYFAQTGNLPRVSGVSIFDACYDLSGFVTVRVPTVSFYFSGGPVLTLPGKNFLIPVNDEGTFCFAFAPSSSGPSIIGNIQQEGIQITIDGANGFVGFGPNVC